MKTTLKSILAVTCLTLAATGVAVAHQDAHDGQPNHCVKGQHKGHHMGMHSAGKPPFLQGIALTSEQEDKVFALTYADLPKTREQMKQRHQLHQELRQLSEAVPFDESKAKQIAEKLANLERDATLSRAKIDSKLFSILTTEQREQVIKNKARFEKSRDEATPASLHNERRQQHPDVRS